MQNSKVCIRSNEFDGTQHIEPQAPTSLGKGEVIFGPVGGVVYASGVERCKEETQEPRILAKRFHVALIERGARRVRLAHAAPTI